MMNDIPNHIVLLNDIHPFLKNYIFSVGSLNLLRKNQINIELIYELRDSWRAATEEEIEYKLFIEDSFDVNTLYQNFKVGDIVVMKKMIYRVSRYLDPNDISYKRSGWLGKKTNGSILFKFIVKEIHPKYNFFKLGYFGNKDFIDNPDNVWFQFADFELVNCLKIPYKNIHLDIKEGDRIIPNVSHLHYYKDDRWQIKNRKLLVKELRVEKIINNHNLKIYGYKNDFYIHDFIKAPENIEKKEITYLPENIKMDKIDILTLRFGEVLLPRYNSIRFSKDNGSSWSNFKINSEEIFIVNEIHKGSGNIGFSNIPYLKFHIDDFFRKHSNEEKNDSMQDIIGDLKVGMLLYPRKNIVSTSINCGNDWLDFKIERSDEFIISNINKTNGNLLFKGIPTMFKFSDFSINLEDDYLHKECTTSEDIEYKNDEKNFRFELDFKPPSKQVSNNFDFNKKQFKFQ